MKWYKYVLLLFCFWLGTNMNHVFAQNASSPTTISGIQDTSCEQVVPSDSAYGFVRILERDNSKLDFMQVNVEIEFKVADNEPCSMTKTTPVELHFPKASLSLKISRQEGQSPFHFSVHRKRLGPIMFLKDIDSICMAYDEEWKRSTWC